MHRCRGGYTNRMDNQSLLLDITILCHFAISVTKIGSIALSDIGVKKFEAGRISLAYIRLCGV